MLTHATLLGWYRLVLDQTIGVDIMDKKLKELIGSLYDAAINESYSGCHNDSELLADMASFLLLAEEESWYMLVLAQQLEKDYSGASGLSSSSEFKLAVRKFLETL